MKEAVKSMRSFVYSLIRFCCILATAAYLCSMIFIPVVQTQNKRLETDFPVLAHRFGSANARIDFVIVLDNSTSMKSIWGKIKDGLKGLIQAIPDGDQISITTFGDPSQNKPTCFRPNNKEQFKLNPTTRISLSNNIGNICDPLGGSTDLGAGVESTLDSLEITGGSNLKVVFFFTDFQHSPPSRSKYENKISPMDAVWQQLRQRKDRTLIGKTLIVYGFKTGSVDYNLDLVSAVFPELESRQVDVDRLTEWFTQIQAEILRDRLKALVQSQIESQGKSQSEGRGPLRIENIVQAGDEIIAQVSNLGSGIINTDGLTQIKVELGEEAQHSLKQVDLINSNLSFDSKIGGLPVVNVPIASIRRGCLDWWDRNEQVNLSFNLTGERLIGPADELKRLNPPGLREVGDNPVTNFTLSRNPGPFLLKVSGKISIWEILLIGSIPCFVVFFVLRRRERERERRREEYLNGRIDIKHHPGNSPPIKETHSLAKSEEVNKYSIGNVDNHEELPGTRIKKLEDVTWTVHFEGRKPRAKQLRGPYLVINGAKAEADVDGRKLKLESLSKPVYIKRRANIRIIDSDSQITYTKSK